MATGVDYPFQVDDDDDHCETSPEAYEDVEAMLGALAEKLGKTRAELAIYDPYFCTGQVVQNLGATPLSFTPFVIPLLGMLEEMPFLHSLFALIITHG